MVNCFCSFHCKSSKRHRTQQRKDESKGYDFFHVATSKIKYFPCNYTNICIQSQSKKRKKQKEKTAAAGTGERIDRGLSTGFTTGLRRPVDHRLPPTTRAGRSLMDNLGKACGQPPTVSTLFSSSTSEAVAPNCVFRSLPEEKEKRSSFRSIGSPLRYPRPFL